MLERTALVVGATGLVGQQVVQELLKDNTFQTIRLLVRNPFTYTHPRVEIQLVNFDSLDDITRKAGKGDTIFCCVGTTRKKVKGDKAAYRKIDHDIPFNLAWAGQQNGFTHYLLVSAVGANPVSDNFYLRLKGSAEEDIANLRYKSILVFRPSMLLGKRKEFRAGELVAKGITKAFSFMLFGALRRYKPIRSATLAKAMIAAAKKDFTGLHVFHYDEMLQLNSLS